MNRYLKILLCLSITVLNILSLNAVTLSDTGTFNAQPVILVQGDTPLLYHASFKVLKYKFTGLIAIRHNADSNETRIVFLAEAGLTIAEFRIKNNRVECVRTLPMVDRKAAKKYLTGILERCLLPGDCRKLKKQDSSSGTSIICKGKNGKHYYIYNEKILQTIIFKSGLSKKTIGFYENGKAKNVLIKKRKKVLVEMKIIENAIK